MPILDKASLHVRCENCTSILTEVLTFTRFDGGPTESKWSVEPCHFCERMARVGFILAPGGVWRIPKYDEGGNNSIVEINAKTAARCVYARVQYLQDQLCAVFHDPKTDETYAQPVAEEYGGSALPEAQSTDMTDLTGDDDEAASTDQG